MVKTGGRRVSRLLKRRKMKYTELNLDQRISLKGLFETEKELVQYRAISLLWDFVKAVEYFLNSDINALPINPYR